MSNVFHKKMAHHALAQVGLILDGWGRYFAGGAGCIPLFARQNNIDSQRLADAFYCMACIDFYHISVKFHFAYSGDVPTRIFVDEETIKKYNIAILCKKEY